MIMIEVKRSVAVTFCLTLLTIVTSLGGTAWAEVELELELGLYNRFTLQRNRVEQLLRYDPQRGAFDSGSYLAPRLDETSYSLLASAGVYLQATSWLGVGLSVDSGQLVPAGGTLPAAGTVPLSSTIYTQLDTIFPGALPQSLPVITTDDRRVVLANGQPVGDEAKETLFIRQAFVRLSAPRTEWLSARLGRISTAVGRSLIYDDFGLGASLQADLERLKDWPLRLGLQALFPTRAWDGSGLGSPLVELRVDYIFFSLLHLVESLGITFSYYHDGDDNFARLFHPSISEAAVKLQPGVDPALHRELTAFLLGSGAGSRADLFWIGLQGSKLFGDLQLSGALIVEVGRLSLENPFWLLAEAQVLPLGALERVLKRERIELDTLGVALELEARYQLTESFSFGGFFIFLSGEDNPFLTGGLARESYSSFLGVMPYLTHTNLFFSGGMNETFSGRRATTAGINGRGVIAPGLTSSWEITDEATVGATSAVLLAAVPSETGDRLYGVEVDLEGSYQLFEFLKLSLEYDLMVAMGFFSSRGVIHKLLVGVDLTYDL
jgi:hypothetical protein